MKTGNVIEILEALFCVFQLNHSDTKTIQNIHKANIKIFFEELKGLFNVFEEWIKVNSTTIITTIES